jgi:MinD-like ATPase involved in chromosome partitioning or flagellar assembly
VIVSFASVKGAPGVTTMACLVGATWPSDRRVMVAECDPSGGDLAARFGLSSRRGWPTFATAVRRSGASVAIEPHLQQLPGGLDVLIGPGGSDQTDSVGATDDLLANLSDESAGVWDVLVDVGRLPSGDLPSSGWLARSDAVVILLRSDAASVLHVQNRAREIHAACGDRVALALVGGTEYGNEEIAEFTGLPVIGSVPFDPASAAVAAGDQGSERRLSRSFLINSALHLSQSLCGSQSLRGDASAPGGTRDPVARGQSVEVAEPAAQSPLVGRSIASVRRRLDRSVRRLRPRTGGTQPIPVPEQPLETPAQRLEEQRPKRQRPVSA